jgi:hypothetical protein
MCRPVRCVTVGGVVAVIVELARSPALVIEPTGMVQAAVVDATAVPPGTVARLPSSTADAVTAAARCKLMAKDLSGKSCRRA